MIEPAIVQIAAFIFLVAALPGLVALTLIVRGLMHRVDDQEALRLLDVAKQTRLERRIQELEHGVGLLIAQIRRAGMTPEWTPTPHEIPAAHGQQAETDRLVGLWQRIDEHFDMDEMNDLAFQLGLPDLSRTETSGARARALVMHAKRRSRLDELMELCRRERPDGGF